MPDATWKQGEAQPVPRVDVDGPRERIAKAIAGREHSHSYAEVSPADVIVLAESVPAERNNGVPDALAKGAREAAKGSAAPEKVYQRTDQLAQLLAAVVDAEPVR